MVHLHFIAEIIDDLFQRFDLFGAVNILGDKRAGGQLHDVEDRARDHIHFVIGFAGKDDILVFLFLRVLGNIPGVVRDTLIVG